MACNETLLIAMNYGLITPRFRPLSSEVLLLGVLRMMKKMIFKVGLWQRIVPFSAGTKGE